MDICGICIHWLVLVKNPAFTAAIVNGVPSLMFIAVAALLPARIAMFGQVTASPPA